MSDCDDRQSLKSALPQEVAADLLQTFVDSLLMSSRWPSKEAGWVFSPADVEVFLSPTDVDFFVEHAGARQWYEWDGSPEHLGDVFRQAGRAFGRSYRFEWEKFGASILCRLEGS